MVSGLGVAAGEGARGTAGCGPATAASPRFASCAKEAAGRTEVPAGINLSSEWKENGPSKGVRASWFQPARRGLAAGTWELQGNARYPNAGR